MKIEEITERNLLASRNVWRDYARELEEELEDIRRQVIAREQDKLTVPRIEGQRLYRVQ